MIFHVETENQNLDMIAQDLKPSILEAETGGSPMSLRTGWLTLLGSHSSPNLPGTVSSIKSINQSMQKI